MPIKTRFAFVAIGILILFVVINLWERYAEKSYPLAKISNLRIGYYANGQIVYSDRIPLNFSQLTACGHLDSPHSKFIIVGVLKSDESIYSAYSDSTKEITPGDFCVPLILKTSELSSGYYVLQVIDQHDIVGEKAFTVE